MHLLMTISPHTFWGGFWLWSCYLLGQAFQVLKRAQLSSWDPNSPVQSIKHFLGVNWPDVSKAFFFSTVLFVTLWRDPSYLVQGVNVILPATWNVSPDTVAHFLQLNILTAAAFGYCSQSLLDYAVALAKKRFTGVDSAQGNAAGKP